MKTTTSLILAVLLSAISLKAEDIYTISDISVRQRWPWSKKVDIDFLVNLPEGGDPTVYVDVTMTAKDGSAPLGISQNSLSGDLSLVGPGWRRIVWDPTVDYPDRTFTQFNVTLSVARSKPTYMIVDLRKQLGETGFITYRYEKGIWQSATNYANCYYCFVMRRVPATTSDEWKAISGGKDYFVLGSPTTEYARTAAREGPNNCRLTNDYWVSHIELSEGQLYNAGAGTVQSVRRASRTYDQMRGSKDLDNINWPSTGHAVADGSILKILRDRTGLEFDLPTEAEWEYACRAGTSTPFADGVYKETYTDADYEASMATLGRCATSGNSAWNNPPYYSPNDWGIFDMHGNYNEWCLDGMIDNVNGAQADPMVNPVGPSTGFTTRAVRNGGATSAASGCRSAVRSHAAPNDNNYGIRLVCPYTDPAQ